MDISKKGAQVLLAVILIAALILRGHSIGQENVWLDEGYSLHVAQQGTFGEVIASMQDYEFNPPLYFITLHYWMKIFGSSEPAIRSLSLIFGILGILIIYLLGQELFERKTALLAAMLMGTSMIQLAYSQEARAYMLFSLLTILSTWLFVRILRDRSGRNYVLYVVVTALLIYSHYFGFLVIFLQGAIAYLFFKKQIREWIKAQAVVGLLFLPWLPHMLSQLPMIHYGLQSQFLYKVGMPAAIGNLGVGLFAVPVLILIGVIVFISWRGYQHSIVKFFRQLGLRFFIVFVLLFGIVYFVSVPQLIVPVYYTRYPIFLFFLFYLGVSKGIVMMKGRWKTVLVLFLLVVNSYAIYTYKVTEDKKEPWSEAVSIISESTDAVILFYDGVVQLPFDYYYKGRIPEIALIQGTDAVKQEYWDSISDVVESKQEVWLVLSHSYLGRRVYESNIEERASLTETYDLEGIKIQKYVS